MAIAEIKLNEMIEKVITAVDVTFCVPLVLIRKKRDLFKCLTKKDECRRACRGYSHGSSVYSGVVSGHGI